jgi:hypothetical protein
MSERPTMYRGFVGFQSLSLWYPDAPAATFCTSMALSPCGQYVETQHRSMDDRRWETTRHELSEYWQPTQAKALAAVAPRLRQIGERLIRQADELEQAAREEELRPALADTASCETAGATSRESSNHHRS